MKYPPVQYHEYLQLENIINSQNRRSADYNKPAHDEMLFIVIHQAYELWFKQIDFELNSIMEIFNQTLIPDSSMGTAVSRLERIISIQKLILGQIDIMETMTPLDFLDFREFLYPASGFQSLQWRLIETKLGLKQENRLNYQNEPFYKQLLPHQQDLVKETLSKESLIDLIEKWLERTPFLQMNQFDFWKLYQNSVNKMFQEDIHVVETNPRLSEDEKLRTIAMLKSSLSMFDCFMSEDRFKELQENGYFKLSFKSLRAALMIQLYRDEPIFQMPFRVLKSLQDIDENMTQWRYRHALMAHRMLGKKIGTGGSSGSDYLKSATEKHKIFTDFFNLTTFLIPRSQVPILPKDVLKKLHFAE